jgi:hypothetical protein
MVTDRPPDSDSRSRARVFLSYSHADPNAEVVRAVHTALTSQHEVFCDIGLEPGALWATEIEAKLAEADYFVVFLSGEAANSKALAEETRRAVKRQTDTGRPRILPVPLAYDIGELGFELGALLKPFQFIFWQAPEDTTDLIDDLRKIFTGAWVAQTAEIAPALSRYVVSPTRSKRMREIFVPPSDVKKARDLIGSGRIIWITGADGAGKHFLASALACELDKPVFELRRTLSWRHIFQNHPAKGVLVLPDALAPERAGTGDYEKELNALRQICETDNTIVLTCSDEEYTTRNSDLIDADFTPAQLARYRLTGETYSLSQRTAIIRKLVTQSHAAGIVSMAQRQWIDKLLNAQQQFPWKDWTLGELESFVTRSLPTTSSPSDVVQLLDRHTTIEDQIHMWFLGLDETARSLLLTLLLFPEATSEQIWARFRTILSELETLRLVPQMSIPTVGVCRARCAPYITQTENLEIVDSDAASSIARELAVSWREFVIELRPLLIRWALPPAGQDRALTRSGADESAAVRQEVARLLGELLKVNVEAVLPFLEDLATFDQSVVRRAAAEAIVYAFGSEDGARNCRKLLRIWEADRSGDNAAVRKREVAAGACWRIAALSKGATNYRFALEQLQRHIRDIPRVRAVVAYGIGRIVGRRSADELHPLMTRLARDQDEIVRRRTGVALSELSRREPEEAGAIFADWFDSHETRLLWTAAYALLVAPRLGRGERDMLHALMHLDPTALAGALGSATTPGDEAKDTDKTEHATRNLLRLAADTESAEPLATALATYWAAHPDRGALLCERLARLSAKPVNDLLVNADRQRLLKATFGSQFQESVLADAGAGGSRQLITTLAVTKIISELTDELQFDPKIAEAWEEAPDRFERFLRWLRTSLGDSGRRAVVLLRRLILESLLEDRKKLVQCAASWLKDPDTTDEAKDTIRAIMKTPELRTRLLARLSVEYWDSRADVWLILDSLGSGSSIIVRQLAFADMLGMDPRRFIDAAVQETQEVQDFPQVGREVLKALAEVAKTKGSAIAVAVRRSESRSNRNKILRLIRDFGRSDPPLKKVAEDLWITRIWLSLQEIFSSS